MFVSSLVLLFLSVKDEPEAIFVDVIPPPPIWDVVPGQASGVSRSRGSWLDLSGGGPEIDLRSFPNSSHVLAARMEVKMVVLQVYQVQK